MKTRRITMITAMLVTCALLLTSCGQATGEGAGGDAEISQEMTTIRVINSKSEVETQMNALADAFNSSHDDITVKIETIPSGVDVQSTLKGYYLADNMPDIIVCEAAGFAKWEGLLVDMKEDTKLYHG